ncbi:MAG: hypothetical protein AB8B53_13755 [Flavobacteriales bacterium]
MNEKLRISKSTEDLEFKLEVNSPFQLKELREIHIEQNLDSLQVTLCAKKILQLYSIINDTCELAQYEYLEFIESRLLQENLISMNASKTNIFAYSDCFLRNGTDFIIFDKNQWIMAYIRLYSW